VAIAPRRGDLELCGHGRQQVLASERGYELDADRRAAASRWVGFSAFSA